MKSKADLVYMKC